MQFAYEAHTARDERGYILECVVAPGNIHDSIAFDPLYDTVTERFPKIKKVVADTAYKTPWICKNIIDDERIPVMPYKRKMGGGKKNFINLMNMYIMNIMIALSARLMKF